MRTAEDEVGDEVVGAPEREAVGAPDREVRALAGLDRPDVVALQHARAAARSETQRLARRHRVGPAAPARDHQRRLHLEEEIAALVRRRAVDAEPDAGTGVEERADRR